MQTKIPPEQLATSIGSEADAILRSCVHCGFCTATCPTYQLLGDELDGPRGRLYLIKEMMENNRASKTTLEHLDRCLNCRSCETTCPSGVTYAHLLESGKAMAESMVQRPLKQRLLRQLMLKILPFPHRFSLLLSIGRVVRPLLPDALGKKIPDRRPVQTVQPIKRQRKVLLIEGCVQPALAPTTDVAAIRLLDTLNIETIGTGMAQCCGAIEHHLGDTNASLDRIRANIDLWLPMLDNGAEAIISTASACALEIKEYGYLLRHDEIYAEKAARISHAARDIAEIVHTEDLSPFKRSDGKRIAFQSPCTLQHGQKLSGMVEEILTRIGYELTPVANAHLCCGSAGTYSILQPEISSELRDNKLAALTSGSPELIATANVGCQNHLQSASNISVIHWTELLTEEITNG